MQFVAIRHTMVDNPGNLCYGRSDIPLAETFDQEAEVIRQQLCKSKLLTKRKFYSSPAERCLRLAKFLAADQPVQIRSEISELCFGQWQGRSWNDIDRNETDAWIEDMVHNAPPEGESFADLTKRVHGFLEDIKQPAILVTHAGVLHAIRVLRLGYTLAASQDTNIKYGEFICF